MLGKQPVRIVYLVHNIADHAVRRRVRMLQCGGGDVTVAGFHRGAGAVNPIADAQTIDLGQTQDAKLASRALSVLAACLRAPAWARRLRGADVLIARNLEMLVLTKVVRSLFARRAMVVYEVLDVHRLMMKDGPIGNGLRMLERWLMGGTGRLLVSSPAFISGYFERWGLTNLPSLLIENKVFAPGEEPARGLTRVGAGKPWRIGWYGMIRCRRSLEMLSQLCRTAPGLVEVDIRGVPSYTEFPDFDARVEATPGMTFGGPYQPSDLPSLYAGVHFAWAIDYMEEGLNSTWLLPNRLYEGQYYGAVPIAERGVETGAWLSRHGAGLLLDDPDSQLHDRMAAMTTTVYEALAKATAAIPTSDLLFGANDCVDLVDDLSRQPA